jgi:hypothetical protein
MRFLPFTSDKGTNMIEETRYKTKKIIDGGIIRYQKVEVTPSDIIAEKDSDIKNLKALVDSLREQITQLELENHRLNLIEAVDSADSYNIYK